MPFGDILRSTRQTLLKLKSNIRKMDILSGKVILLSQVSLHRLIRRKN